MAFIIASPAEIARALGLNRATIYRRVNDGTLDTVTYRGHVWIVVADTEAAARLKTLKGG